MIPLLEILSSEKHVSGEEIARKLGVSRAAVHKQIQKLRAAGYGVAGERKRGYMLVSRTDALLAQEIEHYLRLRGCSRYRIVCHPSAASTQTIAKDLANRGEEEGAVVVAEEQTNGYGRLGREWVSGKGGVWFSLLLRPPIEPERIAQITFVASLAVCNALEKNRRLDARIKWPNDILVSGRKLSGILTEISAEVGKCNWVVIGIGINANNDLPRTLCGAATLSSLSGEAVNRPALLADVLAEFGGLYDGFVARGFKDFEKEYNRRSLLPGRFVRVNSADRVYFGTAEKIDGDGYLWLTLRGGARKKVVAGDVTVLKNQAPSPSKE
ncbi:MAG: biotin--[acetyl-CoA-carboxylase] ligase [Endomicrobiales bacterium]